MAVAKIEMIGDREVQRMLRNLPKGQRKVISSAFRKSAKRVRTKVVERLSPSHFGQYWTGALQRAMRTAKIASGPRSRNSVSIAIALPEREKLGAKAAAASSKSYYPAAIEYGVRRGKAKRPANSYIRETVDRNADMEFRKIMDDMKSGIRKEAERLAGKARKLR